MLIIKALVKTAIKNKMEYREIPSPNIERDEILVKVEYCGICGSDLHAASQAKGYEFIPEEIILGHELSGEIIEIGGDVTQELLGKKVTIIPGDFCRECENCQAGNENICINLTGIGLHYDGAMADYVKVKEKQIILLDDNLPMDIISLTEPMSIAMHAVSKVQDIKRKNILVQGCGIIGVFTAIIAKELGANVTVTGLKVDVENRLSCLEHFSIDYIVVDEQEITQKYDYILECSGSNVAFENSFDVIKKGGTIVAVALYEKDIKLPINTMVRSEIDIISSYSSKISDFYESLLILAKYKENLSKLITVFDIKDGQLAFDKALKKEVLKPILKI